MPKLSIRRSISMDKEMHERLKLVVLDQPRDVTEADVIRDAIRYYLDNHEDLSNSHKFFKKSLRDRLDRLEQALHFQLNVLLFLIATDDPEIFNTVLEEAIVAAKREGVTLLAKMRAVQEMTLDE